jgi:2-keto-4-pentenoate hydratase/2-oxohepta-3-ene-1,7-dioic acid hydratase in catechol pathway
MKLLRYGAVGREKPGILDVKGQVRDLSDLYTDIDGPTLDSDILAELHDMDLDKLPVVTGTPRLGPCISGVGKILCIGLNYRDHAAEAGMPIPNEPIVFMKATSAINGPHDDIIIPRGSQKTDWEVELGVVISQSARYVSVAEALEYVAGYCVINDLSERAFQLEGTGQWVKGKSCDSFGPLGPWLVSKDEVADPQNLAIWLEVNGKRYQNSTTANMIFGVAEIVSYLSHYMTLCPGDVISTGTPAGVGMGLSPPVYLQAGDHLRLGIEGLGEQHPICTASI